MMSLFNEILQFAVGTRDKLSRIPTSKDWSIAHQQAVEQTVVGVCFHGMELIYKSQPEALINLPKTLRMQWLALSMKIQKRNMLVNKRCAELYDKIRQAGYEACLLKGLAFADLYTSPLNEYRQSGDIDMWMMADYKSVIAWGRKYGRVESYDIHHADIDIFSDVAVELHYRPSISRNLSRDRKLQKWFAGDGKMHVNYNERLGVNVPDAVFCMILALNHNLWHLVCGGVGLRQTMDLYYIAKAVEKNKELESLIEIFQLKKFAAASAWVLWHVFEDEKKDSFLLSDLSPLPKPDEKTGRLLLSEIMRGGNFGHYDKRKMILRLESKHLMMLVNLLYSIRLFLHFPLEVLWSPIGMARISLWRRMKAK